jgi:hypothetical protein
LPDRKKKEAFQMEGLSHSPGWGRGQLTTRTDPPDDFSADTSLAPPKAFTLPPLEASARTLRLA